jgi:hypothetical protein
MVSAFQLLLLLCSAMMVFVQYDGFQIVNCEATVLLCRVTKYKMGSPFVLIAHALSVTGDCYDD